MTSKRPRAAVYVRLSRDRVGETSTVRQEKDAKALASARGFKVVEVFSDVDLSAFRPGVVRPAYEQMLGAARAGAFEAVVVWKVDRLARSLREFVRVTELLDSHGVALVSVNESLDTSSPMGRAMLQIIGVFAELESATISLRTKSAKAHSAASGMPNGGGRRPFGYTNQSFEALVPEEADVLREAASRLLGGESLRSIAADIDKRGVTTPNGSPWTSSNLGRTLRSVHLTGARSHRGKVYRGPGWPAIFTEDEHERIRLAAGEHRAASVSRHLLTGLARCGCCGHGLRGKTTKRFGFQYVCLSCAKVSVKGTTAEEFVAEAVLHRLDTDEMRAAMAASDNDFDVRRIGDDLAADRAALEQLSRDHYVTRTVSRDVFLASAGELERRIAEAERKLTRQRKTLTSTLGEEPVRDAWEGADLERRRAILATVVQKIVISPTTVRGRSKFDPERFALIWKA